MFGPPLHAVEREELSLVRHRAELNDFNPACELLGKLSDALANFGNRDRVDEAVPGRVSDVCDAASALWLVPVFGGAETR